MWVISKWFQLFTKILLVTKLLTQSTHTRFLNVYALRRIKMNRQASTLSRILIIELFTFFVLSAAPAPARSHEGHADTSFTAKYVTVTGTIEAIQFDDFKGKKSNRQIFLVDDETGTKYELHFKEMAPLGLLKRQKARIRGNQISPTDIMVNTKEIEIAALDGTSSGSTSTAAAVSGDKKTLVLVMDSNDSVAKCAAAGLTDMFFNSPTASINGMYRDASNNNMSMSGVVVDKVKINVNSAGLCDYSTWSSMALTAAQQMGISTSGYNNYVYILPTANACGWAGLGQLGAGSSWIPGNYCNYPDVAAHELGHNFGLHHARANGNEYGDTSDIMGYGGVGLRMLNSAHMDFMGWIPTSKILTTGVGTFELAPLQTDAAATALPLTVKVRNPVTGGYYYFSLRTRAGFDSNLSSTYADRLNIHSNSGGYSDLLATLGTGERYTDTSSGLSVVVNSISPTSASITISGECVKNSPTVSISPAIQGGAPGQSLSYSATITNRDGGFCANSTFELTPSLPVELASTTGTKSVNIAPGGSASTTLEISSLATAGSGNYNFSVSVGDTVKDAIHAASAIAQYVVDATAPSVPTGLKFTSTKGKTIKIAWLASTDNVGVVGYDIYRNDIKIGSSTTNSFSDNVGRGTYTYKVLAKDSAGNKSALSSSITISK